MQNLKDRWRTLKNQGKTELEGEEDDAVEDEQPATDAAAAAAEPVEAEAEAEEVEGDGDGDEAEGGDE